MYESKVEHPVFEINLLRKNSTFSLSSLAALLNYSATFAVVFILSFYLQYVKSLTPQEAGLILIAQPACFSALVSVCLPLQTQMQ
jgi:Na+/melibiose symporter-like transporter